MFILLYEISIYYKFINCLIAAKVVILLWEIDSFMMDYDISFGIISIVLMLSF